MLHHHIPHLNHNVKPSACSTRAYGTSDPSGLRGDTQQHIRNLLCLASSFLVLSSTINPVLGLRQWAATLDQLADQIVLLHKSGELEPETLNAASQACSQCWSASTSWNDLNEAKVMIRKVATKLITVLDENRKEYKGVRIYGS